MAKIGFVVPVYKVKKDYLDKCIESLTKQTFEDIEIILVDDCSPDSCGKYCEAYAREDNRIKVIHHEMNRGVSAARNTGIENCSSEWISFVDSDDWVELDMCDKLLSLVQKSIYKADIVIFDGWRSYPDFELAGDETGKIFTWETGDDRERLQIQALFPYKKGREIMGTALDSAWGKFYNAEYLKKTGLCFRPLVYREDGMFFQEAVESAECIIRCAVPMYHYRMTSGSLVNSFRQNSAQEQRAYLDLLFRFAEKNNKGDNYEEALYAAVLLSMQIVITLFFFHPSNKSSFFKKYRMCGRYFSQPPFKEVFSHITIKDLTRNHQLKALFIKYKMYPLVSASRNIYMNIKKYKCYE